jgi:stage II sporulation protein D
MFSLSLIFSRFFFAFFLFISFWPWEKETGQVKKSSFKIPEDPAVLSTVRVALFYEKPEIQIGVPGPYEMTGVPGEETLAQGTFLSPTPIRADRSGIRVGSRLYPLDGLRITSQKGEFQIEKKNYGDAIQVLKNPLGSLTVVNEIDIEEYLKGVLPSEMKALWPEEALKAQAVVSRTYAVFKNIENKDFPFTLGSGTGSQVYGGKGVEKQAASRAVDRTRGEILTSRGKVFPAFFHSTCGGRTTRAEYQWKIEPHPSLEGVECNFCRNSPFYQWKAEYSGSEVRNLLAKKKFSVSRIRSIAPSDFDLSGRPRSFEVRHDQGTLKVPANDFRLAVGADRLRSTRFNVTKNGDQFVFHGRGWGHGVGLCQFGAKRLAELGYNYRQILHYYYPESDLQNLEEFFGTGAWSQGPAAEEGSFLKKWFQKVESYFEEL